MIGPNLIEQKDLTDVVKIVEAADILPGRLGRWHDRRTCRRSLSVAEGNLTYYVIGAVIRLIVILE
jgi:hypothetical protein